MNCPICKKQLANKEIARVSLDNFDDEEITKQEKKQGFVSMVCCSCGCTDFIPCESVDLLHCGHPAPENIIVPHNSIICGVCGEKTKRK